MKTLLIITTIIAPYRLKWFEELSRHFNVVVAYIRDTDSVRYDGWLINHSDKCKIIKLKNDKDIVDPMCFDVIKLLKEYKDAIVLFDGYGTKTNLLGLLYFKLIGRNSFTNVDGYALGEKTSKAKILFKKFIVGYLCDKFFCSSEPTKEHLISFGAKREKVFVHNFSSITNDRLVNKPLTKKEKLELRKLLGITAKGNVIIDVGSFIPRKRHEDIIKAVLDLNDENIDLFLLGGKPTQGYLDLVNDNKHIHFVDYVPPEKVDDYYKASNLFVLASQTEVWGLVVNEAMACGLPVVASDNVVSTKSLVDGNGLIYKTGNIDELAKAIDYCLNDTNNKQMSQRSLEIAKDYTIEGMVERQKPILDKCL